jgi:predicted DsbA family dithiol-disulfide isomerase
MASVTVEIWSDIVCPWCYIGEHRFEAALAEFPHRDDVQIIHRSFQLDPTTPRDSRERTLDMLSKKYGVSMAEATAMERRVSSLAQADGLPMRSDRYTANTFDAHRLVHFAAKYGKQDEMLKVLFAGHFANQKLVGDHETLVELAVEVGLDAEETRQVLASDAYAAEVEADLRRAAMFGIRGVPFFVLNEQFGVSGGQAKEVFAQALEQAWTAANPLKMVSTAGSDATCEDGSCAV